MFLVNGSLLMAPLFPRSGPGESGSPTSAVILRCYDFPTRIPGHLFVSLPGSTLSFSVRVSQLPLALPEGRRGPSGPGQLFNRRPQVSACSRVGVSGISQVPRRSVPYLCPAPRPRPDRRTHGHWRSRRCCPRSNDSEGSSKRSISRLMRGFGTCCLRFQNDVPVSPARLASGWLARLCREGVEPSGSQ